MNKRPSTVHRVTSTDDTRTACGVNLLVHTGGQRAPMCSTNPAHITCPGCQKGA